MSRLPLVTGAKGFAGSHLVELLVAEYGAAIGWMQPGAPVSRGGGHDRVEWQEVELLDFDQVTRALRQARPATIYHCAGMAHVAESWAEPQLALRVNVIGTHYLLEAIRATRLQCRVLVTGSALVYKPSLDALREDDPVQPADPYGVSKLAQETVAVRATHVPVVVTRPFNHIGPRQSPAFATSSFARQIAEIEAGIREPILRVGNLDARRDLTDVRDTVRAYRALVEHGAPGRPYNVCSGTAYRVGDLLDALVRLARVTIDIRVDPARLRPNDNPVILGSPARIHAETGWSPRIAIDRSLSDLLDYWREEVSQPQAPRG